MGMWIISSWGYCTGLSTVRWLAGTGRSRLVCSCFGVGRVLCSFVAIPGLCCFHRVTRLNTQHGMRNCFPDLHKQGSAAIIRCRGP